MAQRHLDHTVTELSEYIEEDISGPDDCFYTRRPTPCLSAQDVESDLKVPLVEILAIPETAEFVRYVEYELWSDLPGEVLAVGPLGFGVHYLADKIYILLSAGPGCGSGVSCYLLRP